MSKQHFLSVLQQFINKYSDYQTLQSYQKDFQMADFQDVNQLFALKEKYHPELNTFFRQRNDNDWMTKFIVPLMEHRVKALEAAHRNDQDIPGKLIFTFNFGYLFNNGVS